MSLLRLAYIIARRRIISTWQLETVVFLSLSHRQFLGRV